jgi:hypothetical protein
MTSLRRLGRATIYAVAALSCAGGPVFAEMRRDPANPTCPANPDLPSNREMSFSVREVGGQPVLLAEGLIDEGLLPRLRAALEGFEGERNLATFTGRLCSHWQ